MTPSQHTPWTDHRAAMLPIALAVVAAEVHLETVAAERDRYLARQNGWLPDLRPDVGSEMRLRVDDVPYRLTVHQLDRERFLLGTAAGHREVVLRRRHEEDAIVVRPDGSGREIHLAGGEGRYRLDLHGRTLNVDRIADVIVRAPVPGVLTSLAWRPGELVAAGTPLAVLESMKLLTTVSAPVAGRIGRSFTSLHQPVACAGRLVELQPPGCTGDEATDDPLPGDPPRPADHRALLDALRSCLLGYDVDPSGLATALPPPPDTDGADLATEAEVLGLAAGLVEVGPQVVAGATGLFAPGLRRVPHEDTYRLSLAYARMDRLGPAIATVLERWLSAPPDSLSSVADVHRLLQRLTSFPPGWGEEVGQLADTILHGVVRRASTGSSVGTSSAAPPVEQVAGFSVTSVHAGDRLSVLHVRADGDPSDHRLVARLTLPHLPERSALEQLAAAAVSALRATRIAWPRRDRPRIDRIVIDVPTGWRVPLVRWRELVRLLAPHARGLDLAELVVRSAVEAVRAAPVAEHGVRVHRVARGPLVEPLDDRGKQVVASRRRGSVYPYALLELLTPPAEGLADFPHGDFAEHDLDEHGALRPVERPSGGNRANVVVGVITNRTPRYPEGMCRVIILGDPTRSLGSLAGPECRRIVAALDLAEHLRVPVEWFAVSSGARIAMDSGTENMDAIADVLRRLVEFTQAGGEVNVIVTGINVGGQPYWNAEATMLMHTRGILVMTTDSALVLTGKDALDRSGGVSADDNLGIGGFDRVMGPNGQAQYRARTIEEACDILFRHYEHTYVAPGERFPRLAVSQDPRGRDVRSYRLEPVPGSALRRVGDIFSSVHNRERKSGFSIRSVMRAVVDQDLPPMERWAAWRDAATSVVWEAHLGGQAVCLVGIESRHVPRVGVTASDGPSTWTAGTLFPHSAKKIARALNAASGNRPAVVLANLSGFDGSPESLRAWQLEYGAEIGRAVTNFDGPLVVCVLSRYHGGAFVVFSKRLNPNVEILAVEGAYASVIGGVPAASVVLGREVRDRADQDPRVAALLGGPAPPDGTATADARARLELLRTQVWNEKLVEVADEYDRTHDIARALRVGSIDRIIPPATLRPSLIDAVRRGMARSPTPRR